MIEKLWDQVTKEAKDACQNEPLLANYVTSCVLGHDSFESSLSFILAQKISTDFVPLHEIEKLFIDAFCSSPTIIESAAHDVKAAYERDPAVCSYLTAILHLRDTNQFKSID